MHLNTCHCPARPVFSGLLSKARTVSPVDGERAAVKKARVKVRKLLAAFLAKQAEAVADQLADVLGLAKAKRPAGGDSVALAVAAQRAADALAGLELQWTEIVDPLSDLMAGLMIDAGAKALAQVGSTDEAAAKAMRASAEDWAQARAAEMVGMKRAADGTLVQNPAAQWRIDEPTRDMLRATVTEALEEGWSTQRLRSAILESHGFSKSRADMIARTELARADMEGQVIGWRASGIVAGKTWLTADDCCSDCQDLNGETVGLDATFPGGVQVPPLHPNCRCSAVPDLGPDT